MQATPVRVAPGRGTGAWPTDPEWPWIPPSGEAPPGNTGGSLAGGGLCRNDPGLPESPGVQAAVRQSSLRQLTTMAVPTKSLLCFGVVGCPPSTRATGLQVSAHDSEGPALSATTQGRRGHTGAVARG